MVPWLLSLWRKILRVARQAEAKWPCSQHKTHLTFEQLEDRTVPSTFLVKDIRTGAQWSSPGRLTEVNGTLFFVANDGSTGFELWKSDGTSTGTVLVKDIWPGSDTSNPAWLTNVNGTLFFVADDGSNGQELWKSDGTSTGTMLVKDILPGSNPSSPSHLANVNGTLFFRASDGTYGFELWRSDGTSGGTVLLKDFRPGVASSYPGYLTNVNGTLFFKVNDGTFGFELWRSDGTSLGTVLVKDIRPGPGPSQLSKLTNINGTLFFVADDGSQGEELWSSDGTSVGTVLVRDISPGGGSSYPQELTNVNGVLFFTANDGSTGRELWKSDGTSTGTLLVTDIWPGTQTSLPAWLTNVNGTLFFSARDTSVGQELWKTDGTSAGTAPVKDILSGGAASFPEYLTNVNGTLFFAANDGSTGYELWKSDGTSAGTVLVQDIRSGTASSNPGRLTNVNGTLFFSADDGSTGHELWASVESPPTITGITPPANGTYSVGQDLDFQVQFSEIVVVNTSGGTPRLELTIGSTTRYATYQSGSGTNTLLFRYTVQAGDLDTDGIAVSSPLDLNGGMIRDNAGNDASLTFTPPSTSGVLVDGVAPTIVSITPAANGTYRAGQALDVLVQFSEAVNVGTTATAKPYIRLRIGSAIRNAEFLNQPSATTLRFRYLVQTGDLDTNGIEILSPIVRPTGTFIRDLAGNNASTTFSPPSTPNVKVDAVAPTIVQVTPPANGHYVTGQVLDILVRFSEAVNVGTTATAKPYIRLRIGSVIRNAVFVNKPNATTLRFRYVIQASDSDTNGIEILSPIVRPTGTFIRDLAGNNAIVTFVPPDTRGVRVN